MGMIGWAEQEIATVKKQNKNNSYICNCLDSALKAYKSIMLDEHSGISYWITAGYLKKLLDEIPLVPVIDDDDQWTQLEATSMAYEKSYSHIHMPGLFKNIYPNGKVEYYDAQRWNNCHDTISGFGPFHNGFVSRICEEYVPITFPYVREKFKVYVTQFLVDPSKGDYDTLEIIAIFDGNNNTIIKEIHRYFKENGDNFVEIDFDEYCDRFNHRVVKNI